MAAESEQWTTGTGKECDLNHDFEKLLYVFAPLRILICTTKDVGSSKTLLKKLTDYANGCCVNFNPGAALLIHFRFNIGGSVTSLWQSAGDPVSKSIEPIDFTQL